MISLLSVAANAVVGLLISVLKALFSMVSWFFGLFFKMLKMLFCLLPVTSVAFVALLGINIFILVTGNVDKLVSTSESSISNEGFREEAKSLLSLGDKNVMGTYTAVRDWWMKDVYGYKGSVVYILLVFLTVIMFIPVATVLLCLTVFESYGIVLFSAIAVDAVIYVFRAILGKNFTEQFKGRYAKLFPEAGQKLYESEYRKWLKNKEYAKEEEELRAERERHNAESFYDDDRDYYDDGDYYDEDRDYEDAEDYDDDRDYRRSVGKRHNNGPEPIIFGRKNRKPAKRSFDLRYDDDSEYEDEYDDDHDDNYDDSEYDGEYEGRDYEDRNHDGGSRGNTGSASGVFVGTFDFFAGCNSRDSVDKKYRSLVKLYHPDNMDGDTAALQEINVQYDKAKLRFPL